MLKKYGVHFSDISGMALVAYDPDGSVRWWNMGCTINITGILFFQYTVITYCTIRMCLEMEAKLELVSESLRNLHKQFFKTLVLQIATPTVILLFPVLIIIYLPILDLELDVPTGIFLCAFTLYPAMDAIIVMYVVKDYSMEIKKMFKNAFDVFTSSLRPAADITNPSEETNGLPLASIRVLNS
ncbi:Protein CBG10396 [Caenorhabditis briggsae]|uniref:Protein CBG10396 n=1 Tax=Caenorhabditis briggsae TaxID=6238 RepID=A8XB39_CAEBR|nr:Protein CBG10396 [Caenorhabditis briggsae]CAP29819.2 Protein CBG10396 [Caenorhabditis briggsae]